MSETTVSVFLRRARRDPERLALRHLHAGGADREQAITWGDWEVRSRNLALALIQAGVRPGDRVAVLAGNRPLWPLAELGILMAGAVSVGIYPTSAVSQVKQILADSGAVIAFADKPLQLRKICEARNQGLPALRQIVCEETATSDESVASLAGWLTSAERDLEARRSAEQELDSRIKALDAAADALLIYTSGSTGEPKGARISHRYLLASARSIRDTLGLRESDSALSFLPYCHAAERVFGLHTRILCGMEAGLVEDHRRLYESARAFGPTLFGGLPRFFEKVYEEMRGYEAEAGGTAAQGSWARVMALGAERSKLRRCGAPVPAELESEWLRMRDPLLERAREFFGGKVRLITSGGAALPAGVAEYLDALGLTILGAYGLTEHLCVAFNRPCAYTFDSAGPPMPGTELRIARDGEILVRRSELTFSGYHRRAEEDKQAFSPDGNWLRTGDLGSLGTDGMLRITGRKKDLLALSTGKKIAPGPIESALVQDPFVGQAVLIGEGRKFVSALVTLRRPVVERWARQQGIAAAYSDLLRHPSVLARVQLAVDAVNNALSSTETIRRFVVLEDEFSAEREELTPTLKVRRSIVAERYRDRLDHLYSLPET